MEIKLFNSFNYIVGNSFINKSKREVKVFFIYKKKYNITLPLMINKVQGHEEEIYYINKAKEIVDKMIKDKSLIKYSNKYIKENNLKKRFLYLWIPLSCACMIAGVITSVYFALTQPTNPEPEPVDDLNYFYIKNIGDTTASINFLFSDAPDSQTAEFTDLHYSKDKKDWTKIEKGNLIGEVYVTKTTISSGETFYYYGNNPNGLFVLSADEQEAISSFMIVGGIDEELTPKHDGDLEIGGNILSLIYGTEFDDKNKIPTNNCFACLFASNFNLVTAEELILPSAGLTEFAFFETFAFCGRLKTAPLLPAPNSELIENADACYACMFQQCVNLEELKVNFGPDWPDAANQILLDGAGTLATSPTFYWKGEDDPGRTIIPEDSYHVPEGWEVKHW